MRASVALAAVLALSLTACDGDKKDNTSTGTNTAGGGAAKGLAGCNADPLKCNSGEVKQGGTITYAIEKKITGWNVNSGDTNTFDIVEVMEQLSPSAFNVDPKVQYYLNDDLLDSAEVSKADPMTVVYKIKKDAVWSDGTAISADDWDYAWKTQNGKDCKDCGAASTGGYDLIKSLTGSDGGKTVTVEFEKPFPDWKVLFGPLYPAHLAKQQGDLLTSFKWFDATVPTWSGGPFLITNFTQDVSVTMEPNPKWYGHVKSKLDKLIFRIITEQSQQVPALQNNEVQAIYPQPNADIVSQVKQLQGISSVLSLGGQYEHLDLQTKNPLLADVNLRKAMFTALSREDIISKTIGQFAPDAKPLNSHMFLPTQDGYKDNVSASGQGSGDVEKAKKFLTDAGYTGVGSAAKTKDGKDVKMRCSFTEGNVLRQQTCELIQSQMSKLGVGITPTPIPSLGKALASGDFDLIIFAWVLTPAVFNGNFQTFTPEGGSNYNNWENKDAQDLIRAANQETDVKKAIDNLNKADELMVADASTLPLFQKPTYLAAYSNILNIRSAPNTFGPPYNAQEWGLKP